VSGWRVDRKDGELSRGKAQPQRRIVEQFAEYVARIVDINVEATLPAIDPGEDVLKI
jgi:hypothetical protein